ncbi:MAG TPA: NAD(P)/FAD-dependent oxidoreductase [Pyrinomonadaceae bacterium]|jgi:kynurenine 3-monooxygenase
MASLARRKITIIGAGMGGTMMAIFLARRGFEVDIYERRHDLRVHNGERGRSINMTVSIRGLRVLEEVGILNDKLLSKTIKIKGRMIHNADGTSIFQPYGINEDEVLYSIVRSDLNAALMNYAESHPNVKFHFNTRCVKINKDLGMIDFENEITKEGFSVSSDLIVGADGTFSTVRQQMHRGERANFHQEFMSHGYKELVIPPGRDGEFRLDHNALHLWPRGQRLFLALPNSDHSFTGTCILPFEGERSFASLKTEADVLALFNSEFKSAVPLMPTLTHDFLHNRLGEFITTKTSHWYHKDQIVLLGDSCHTVTPFYGQGMNAAFEDCLVMNQCIGQYGDDWETTFMEYQRSRKRNTDALADLSLRNFDELRESVKSPSFVARKQLDIILNRLFPNTWIPLYTLISHSVIPYADAIDRVERQQRLVKMMGLELILSTFARAMSVLNFIKNLPVYFREKMTADRYQTLQLKPSSPKRTFNTNLVTDQSEPLS